MKPYTISYESLIPYKISELVLLIIEKNKSDFTGALQYLFVSQLYMYLTNETTKLWHLSDEQLFDLLENEKKTSNFVFPDFV
jgi:hypothetical protein